MKTESIDLDALYAELESFGPQRGLPTAERLRKKLPALSESKRTEIESVLSDISKTVWELAERGGESKVSKTELIGCLQAKHPFLRGKGLTQALFLTNYYAWHEGYDK